MLKIKNLSAKIGDKEILKNINIDLSAGQCLLVTGQNGAGKSTMLQVLAGILEPSAGTIEVRGKIATLLQLGAGFDPALNARENTLLVGEFLGVPHAEMVRRVPAILEFAGLGEFADAEVRTYSSGMRARLGFSVATSVEPDVLLLDEVLSTGDAAFIEKSRGRITELMKRARAIVFVTHDLDSAAAFCTRAIELEGGRIVADGPAKRVVAAYKKKMAKRAATASRSDQAARRGS
jgi:ABC-type polysaccharide/polyol phosphate transport system ATPase subunit